LPKLKEPVRYSSTLNAKLADLVESVKASALEGLVAKGADSRYEPGIRSGAWKKMRINQGQEFVIGGYTVGGTTFDALIFGYYEEKKLMYAARTETVLHPPYGQSS
jgi:ATP-dependent DNA ligase